MVPLEASSKRKTVIVSTRLYSKGFSVTVAAGLYARWSEHTHKIIFK